MVHVTGCLGRMETPPVSPQAFPQTGSLCEDVQQCACGSCQSGVSRSWCTGCSGAVECTAEFVVGDIRMEQLCAELPEGGSVVVGGEGPFVGVGVFGAADCLSSPPRGSITVQVLPGCPVKPSKPGRQFNLDCSFRGAVLLPGNGHM